MLTDAQAKNIQGIGIAGFRKDQQQLIFVRINDAAKARGLLSELTGRTANAWEVKQFNDEFSEIKHREGNDPDNLKVNWVATLISANGYRKLGVNTEELAASSGHEAFKLGMAGRSQQIGDTRAKDMPSQWLAPFRPDAGVDILIVTAGDDPEELAAEVEEIHNQISAHGCETVFDELGETLPNALRGHEHFGFKDGISQPAIAEWDDPPAAGEPPAIPLGEFVLGYTDAAGETTNPGDLWTDGSFVVFRRLRQDVFGFRAQAAQGVSNSNPVLDAPNLSAKMIGRWPSGSPLETNPDADSGAISNAFDYDQDGEGFNVPRFSHIRKVNPRKEGRPDLAQDPTERHRMLRRGSPFGPPLGTDATADDGADRGLHFISVVSDVSRQFEFVQSNWMNNPNFPNGVAPAIPAQPYGPPPTPSEFPDGPDPIAGQFDANAPDALHQPSGVHAFPLLNEVVTVTAGEYLFAPSLAALERLAGGATASTSAAAGSAQG